MSEADTPNANSTEHSNKSNDVREYVTPADQQTMSEQPGNNNQPSSSGGPSPDFEEMLARLDLCTELIHSELEAYRNASFGSEPSTRTDYLLSVVIPVFNEQNTIGRVLSRVASLKFEFGVGDRRRF